MDLHRSHSRPLAGTGHGPPRHGVRKGTRIRHPERRGWRDGAGTGDCTRAGEDRPLPPSPVQPGIKQTIPEVAGAALAPALDEHEVQCAVLGHHYPLTGVISYQMFFIHTVE